MAKDVISLNKFKKRKAKAAKEERAEANRKLHGRTKAERQADAASEARAAAERIRLEKRVDGAFLEREPQEPDDDEAQP